MKKLSVFLFAMVLVFGVVGTANAATIDFESTGLSEGDSLTDQISGLTFINTIIAMEGEPLFAFNRTKDFDTVLWGGPFGGFFITDPVVEGDPLVPGTIEILFDTPVFNFSFCVADIEANAHDEEVLTAQAFDSTSTLLETLIISGSDPGAGNSWGTLATFSSSNIARITIEAVNSEGYSGWGVDNLSFSSVPIPGIIWLLGSGLAVAVGYRSRLKKI